MGPRPATTAWALGAYMAARHRLPEARCPDGYRAAGSLSEIVDPYELVLLDAYGVLNVGEEAIPGAVARIAELRRRGKRVMVISNSAGYPHRILLERYARMGFDFAPDEVVSSRQALLHALAARPAARWGAMLSPVYGTEDLGALDVAFLEDDPALYDGVDGFLLVGSDGWSDERQALLERALAARPRPVLVGNPDIVAPRREGLSLEPGHYAHRLADALGVEPEFHGKPFTGIYELALERLPAAPPPDKVLMVGDTLHTDVLGGRAMGFDAALVTGYGSLAGADVDRAIRDSGITPDYVIPRP